MKTAAPLQWFEARRWYGLIEAADPIVTSSLYHFCDKRSGSAHHLMPEYFANLDFLCYFFILISHIFKMAGPLW